MTHFTAPVRHFVWDDFVAPRADWVLPPPEWGGWEARYSNDLERGKRASRDMVPWAADVLRQMHELDVLQACARLFGVGAFPDASLWGGGLQTLDPGGWLATHLDGNRHPKRPGLRRAVQLVCFVHPTWGGGWGGGFAFFRPNGDLVTKIDPVPGRLLAFENTDLAYHGVLPTAPGAAVRATVATSLLAEARPGDTRERALFMPMRTTSPP